MPTGSGDIVKPRSQGLAYVTLMVSIAIISIVAASAVQLGHAQGQRDMEEELLFIGQEFQMALSRYANATPVGMPRSPRDVAELLRDPRYPGTVRHLRRAYADPLSGSDDWIWVKSDQGLLVGVHSSSTRKPLRERGFGDGLVHLEAFKAATYRDWIFWGPDSCRAHSRYAGEGVDLSLPASEEVIHAMSTCVGSPLVP